jgi:hypothetical protein
VYATHLSAFSFWNTSSFSTPGPTDWVVMQRVETVVHMLHCYSTHVVGQVVASVSPGATFPAWQLWTMQGNGGAFSRLRPICSQSNFFSNVDASLPQQSEGQETVTQTLSFILHGLQGYPHPGSSSSKTSRSPRCRTMSERLLGCSRDSHDGILVTSRSRRVNYVQAEALKNVTMSTRHDMSCVDRAMS